MNVIELDKRLVKNLKELEKTIIQYEGLLKEVDSLKDTYKNQIDNNNKSFLEFNDQIKKDYELSKLRLDSYIVEVVKHKENIKKAYQTIDENEEQLKNKLTNLYSDYEIQCANLRQNNTKNIEEAEKRIYDTINLWLKHNNKDMLILKSTTSGIKKEMEDSNSKIDDNIRNLNDNTKKRLDEQLSLSAKLSNKLINLIKETDSKFQEVEKLVVLKINEIENSHEIRFQDISGDVNNKFELLNKEITEGYKELEKKIEDNNKDLIDRNDLTNKKIKSLSITFAVSIIIVLILLFGR